VAVVVRLPASEGGRVYVTINGEDPRTGVDSFDTSTLPAGTYRLYLLTKGRGSVSVRFPELAPGRRQLGITHAATVRASQQAPTALAGIYPSDWAAGIAVPSGPRAFWAFAYDWQRSMGSVSAAGQAGMCVYPHPPASGHYLSECAEGSAVATGWFSPIACCGTGYGSFYIGRGDFAFGTYYTQAAAITDAGAFYLALGL
jgi:hypothetical protein